MKAAEQIWPAAGEPAKSFPLGRALTQSSYARETHIKGLKAAKDDQSQSIGIGNTCSHYLDNKYPKCHLPEFTETLAAA